MGSSISLKPLVKLLGCSETLESLNLTSCRGLPRGMKRLYGSRENVEQLKRDIESGKFDPKNEEESDEDD